MPKAYIFLLLAIFFETIGTSALKLSDGFTKLWPSIIVVLGYGASFYLLSLSLRSIPVGIAYGIWSAFGIVLIAAIGWLFFRQALDTAAILGLGLIIAGVLVIQLFSNSISH